MKSLAFKLDAFGPSRPALTRSADMGLRSFKQRPVDGFERVVDVGSFRQNLLLNAPSNPSASPTRPACRCQ
jgi:hypothetical protein